MKVSIVIPNFNGEELLKKNLPNILASGADEVIVLDDKSNDKSLKILSKFKVKNENLKILVHKENKGFILSVNELFKNASGEIVVLLNNDVFVEEVFLETLKSHFNNEKVFAVNLHEKGEGPSFVFWKNGFFEFGRGEEGNMIAKSAWASGGSAAYSKNLWQELGGFDPIFAPFYWEDIDLSYRAIKMGWEILWEPRSKVVHQHETIIKKTFNKRYITWVQQRNQFLFIWKNIKDYELISNHRKGLIKRLLSSGLGYFIPYLWALAKSSSIKKTNGQYNRSDLETINYANS